MPYYRNCYHFCENHPRGCWCDLWGDFGPPCAHFYPNKCNYYETEEDRFLIPDMEYSVIEPGKLCYRYSIYYNGPDIAPTHVLYFGPNENKIYSIKKGENNE